MPIFYKLIDIRFTQSLGWVVDCLLNKQSVLPVSLPVDYHAVLAPGFAFNQKRLDFQNAFEQALAQEYNALWSVK